MTEEQIVQLLKNENQGAISYLYDHYSASLFGVALRIVRSRELAEQVLQDSFLKVWRNGSQYDRSKGKLYTWMLNITRNTAIDATRTSYYKFYDKTDDISTLYAYESSEGIQTDHVGLQQLVGKLDEKYRILIEKIYFEGYTQQEIVDEMNIPIGTVKTRVRAAIEQLRGVFGSAEAPLIILFLEKFIAQ